MRYFGFNSKSIPHLSYHNNVKNRLSILSNYNCSEYSLMGSQQSSIPNGLSCADMEIQQYTPSLQLQDIAESVIFPKNCHDLSPQNIKFIYEQCQKISLFADLPHSKLQQIIKKFVFCLSDTDQWLFREGSNASFFFIVAEGHLDVIKNGLLIRTLGPGDSFGEMAMLYGIKRSSSIKVVKQYRSKNKYFALKKNDFLQAIHYVNPVKNQQFLGLIQNNIIFHYLTLRDKMELAMAATKINFKNGERILTKFDQPYALFVINKGSVQLKFPNKRQVEIAEKDVFGYFGSKFIDCSACSTSQTTLYTVGKNAVDKILNKKMKFLHLWSKVKYALLNCDLLKHLSLQKIEQLTSLFSFKYSKTLQPLCRCQTYITKLFIPITCTFNEQIQIYGVQDFLSDKCLYRLDLMTQKSGHYAQIDSQIFKAFAKNHFINVGTDQYLTFDLTKSQIVYTYPKIQGKPQQMICRQSRFNQYYLLSLAHFNNQHEVQQIMQQRDIYQQIQCKLIQSYYFFMERNRQYLFGKQYIRGTKIKQIILKIGTLPYSISKFYIACMVGAIEYLHSKNIICQNLQISAFKVDEVGYLTLSEFEAKKIDIKSQQGKKQISQNIKRVGQMAYYLLIGNAYIQNSQVNQTGHKQVQFPSGYRSKDAKQFLQELLLPNQQSITSLTNVKQMNMFKTIDWKMLINKQIQAPIIPGFMGIQTSTI